MSVVEEALEHAEREVKSPIPMSKRNACDEAFLAAVKAIDEFLVKRGYPEPERHGERFRYLRYLESADPEVARAELSEKLGARFGKAREACFYGGEIELAEEEVRKSRELVELIRSLSK